MKGGQPCRAKGAILLLRVLQDHQRNLVIDWRDAVADAERQRLEAMRTFGWRFRLRGGLRGIQGLIDGI